MKQISSFGFIDGIKRYSFPISVFFILLIEFFFLGITTYVTLFVLFLKFCSSVVDSILLLIPLLFLKGRWRYLYVVVPFIVGVLIISNVLFYRHFNDLIPASSYFASGSFNKFVVDSALASFRWYDALVLLLPFSLLTFLFYPFRKYVLNYKIGRRKWLGVFILLIGCWGMNLAGNYRKVVIVENRKYLDIKGNLEILFSQTGSVWFSWKNIYYRHNFIGYALYCCFTDRGKEIELSNADYSRIKKCIREISKNSQVPEIDINSEKETISQKNLIMIIVESWPYKTLELDFSQEIIPGVLSLLQEKNVILKKARKLTGVGNSSDAQLMYNTGLLPLRSEPFVPNFALKNFPSLAKALDINSFEVIGEDPQIWSHNLTNRSYGFDRLIRPQMTFISDSLIFDNALNEISKMDVPFFSFITTISMHDPYIQIGRYPGVRVRPELASDERDLAFLEKMNYFDRSLRRFINSLRRMGVYDNSIIVIAGDHPICTGEVSEMLEDEFVPVIILNSSMRPYEDIEMTQLDLFPSVLDLMGVKTYNYLGENYRGLGKSIFKTSVVQGGVLPEDELYEVSDLLIRGK